MEVRASAAAGVLAAMIEELHFASLRAIGAAVAGAWLLCSGLSTAAEQAAAPGPAQQQAPWVEVPQKALKGSPLRFEPQGRFVGVVPKDAPDRCDVWGLRPEAGAGADAYLGRVPAERCAGWIERPFEMIDNSAPKGKKKRRPALPGTLASPDGSQQARLSPDRREIRITDAQGKKVATLRAGTAAESDEKELFWPGTWAWGPDGFLALGRVATEDKSDGGYIQATVYTWGDLRAAPKKIEFPAYSLTELDIALDPRGRFVFLVKHHERSGDELAVHDMRTGEYSGLSWQAGGRDPDSYQTESTEERPGRWVTLRGAPVWETFEIVRRDDDSTIRVWRIGTAKGARRLKESEVRRLPRGLPRSADPAKSVDPSGRFSGTGRNSLRRVADGEELTFDESGCAHSKRGAFSCGLQDPRSRVYLLDPDPLSGKLVRGDQLAWAMHAADLVDAFFEGRPLPPRDLPARVGLPPSLELAGVEHRDREAQGLRVRVIARDGGDGVGVARVRYGGDLRDETYPLADGKETTLALTVPKKNCEYVWVYACNRQGIVCSLPVRAPYCPRDKHRVPAASSYEEQLAE